MILVNVDKVSIIHNKNRQKCVPESAAGDQKKEALPVGCAHLELASVSGALPVGCVGGELASGALLPVGGGGRNPRPTETELDVMACYINGMVRVQCDSCN